MKSSQTLLFCHAATASAKTASKNGGVGRKHAIVRAAREDPQRVIPLVIWH